MVFELALIPSALLPALAGALLFRQIYFQPPLAKGLELLIDTCGSYENLPAAAREASCLGEVFFADAFADPLAACLLFMVVLLWIPVSLVLFEQGGKLGRSAFLAPGVLIFIAEIGMLECLGPFVAIAVPILLVVVRTLERKPQEALPPASRTYTLTSFGLHHLAFVPLLVFAYLGVDTTTYAWYATMWSFMFFPSFVLPLAFFTPAAAKSGEWPAAPGLWKVYGYLLIPLWWIGVILALFLYQQQHEKYALTALLLFWDALGVVVTHLGLHAVESSGSLASLTAYLVKCLWAGPPAATIFEWAAKEQQAAEHFAPLLRPLLSSPTGMASAESQWEALTAKSKGQKEKVVDEKH